LEIIRRIVQAGWLIVRAGLPLGLSSRPKAVARLLLEIAPLPRVVAPELIVRAPLLIELTTVLLFKAT
jgi:hypothetical protein